MSVEKRNEANVCKDLINEAKDITGVANACNQGKFYQACETAKIYTEGKKRATRYLMEKRDGVQFCGSPALNSITPENTGYYTNCKKVINTNITNPRVAKECEDGRFGSACGIAQSIRPPAPAPLPPAPAPVPGGAAPAPAPIIPVQPAPGGAAPGGAAPAPVPAPEIPVQPALDPFLLLPTAENLCNDASAKTYSSEYKDTCIGRINKNKENPIVMEKCYLDNNFKEACVAAAAVDYTEAVATLERTKEVFKKPGQNTVFNLEKYKAALTNTENLQKEFESAKNPIDTSAFLRNFPGFGNGAPLPPIGLASMNGESAGQDQNAQLASVMKRAQATTTATRRTLDATNKVLSRRKSNPEVDAAFTEL